MPSSELAFPFSIDANGGIATTSDPVELARKHIIAAVGTSLAERVMRPTYGCESMQYVFDPDDALMTGLLEAELERAIAEQVSEVSVLTINMGALEGTVTAEIDFRLSDTGDLASVTTQVYTATRLDGIVYEENF